MSTTKRLISGSAASWVQIGITILSQIALVPIYLSFWDVQTYGLWIGVQALVAILATLDHGHQNYLGFEFLKLGQNNKNITGAYLASGMVVGVLIGMLELLIMFGLIVTGVFGSLLDETVSLDPALIQTAGYVLLMQGVVWLLTGSLGGILVRALTAFDYFPRLAWWGVCSATLTSAAPAIAVAFGAGLLVTGIAAASATLFFNAFLYRDMFSLLRKEEVHLRGVTWQIAWRNFLQSLALSGKKLLESARSNGVRIILTPLSGTNGLVAFTTIRTGANFAMQGLNSITNPLMPELMKFLHQRDQARSETAFGTIWIVIIAIMAPGVIILQAFIEPFFIIWTQGKVPFDPMLFAVLSLGVLIYAIAQPAMAIVTGNNLLKAQLWLSALAALIVVCGMFILVPHIGILGAGLALLVSELVAAIGYGLVAKRWLFTHGLEWPRRSSRIAYYAVGIAALAMAALILFPQAKYVVLLVALFGSATNLMQYWKTLPEFTRQRTREMMHTLPIIKKLIWK